MNIFEIIIQSRTEEQSETEYSWPVVVKYTPFNGYSIEAKYTLKLNSNYDQELRAIENDGKLKKYGTILGEALFSNSIRISGTDVNEKKTSLETDFSKALPKDEKCLHVLLRVDADDLKHLRWERLRAPINNTWDYLARNNKTPFYHYIPTMIERLFPAIGRRGLRALIVVASPDKGTEQYGLQHFNVESTVTSLKTAFGDIPCDVLAKIDGAIGTPTLKKLIKLLSRKDKYYTILHLVCHGRVIEKETVIYLNEDEDENLNEDKNRLKPVKTSELIDQLRSNIERAPHFTFLSSCESGSSKAEAIPEIGGLAQSLVRDLGMPAVLGMTDKITIKTAQDLATAFYKNLREHGYVGLALAEATAQIRGQADETVPALFSRLGERPLFDENLDRPLSVGEIEFGLALFEKLLKKRAPIMKDKFNEQKEILQRYLNIEGLNSEATDEGDYALKEINQLCNQVLEISFNSLAVNGKIPNYNLRCPFKGLFSFTERDSKYFFGRDKLIEKLKNKLKEHDFLAVLGASGSGKSSVVKAGLIPNLKRDEKYLQVKYIKPGKNPLENLQSALSNIKQEYPLILVIDQFEELFTLCNSEAARKIFIEELLALVKNRKQRVVITMRADFWGECARYTQLKDLMQEHQELISPMEPKEIEEAIKKPAKQVGLQFEIGLINSICNELEGEPGALPLLQHTLLELWKRRHGRNLVCEEYIKIGGVSKAIATTADNFFYKGLSKDKEDKQEIKKIQEKVKNIFLRLTRLDESFEEIRDTRKRVYLKNLSHNDDLKVIDELVQKLAKERLLVTNYEKKNMKEQVKRQ
ncbi:CHAT domain-containing protein [Nostoc sp. LEGE 12447]|uniref:nSTAND1 domain-containing NTPase n=1 Tax=Nostoc sp. LEGE 12447 TaxID=1828640 RepID=UPI001884132A|nr:CHAT domain-containing protein [Nostoc sp. LEGE 12447]MBE9001862.1 CHAT domain-containing protein [Nostoc sp. LEGE 12447]